MAINGSAWESIFYEDLYREKSQNPPSLEPRYLVWLGIILWSVTEFFYIMTLDPIIVPQRDSRVFYRFI